MIATNFGKLLKRTFSEWTEDKAPRLGAALAYYTVFSIAPLLIITITIVGLALGGSSAQEHILTQLQGLIGDKGKEMIESMMEAAQKPTTSTFATIAGVVTLIFGASGVFIQLKDALNSIWKVKPKTGGGIWGFARNYFLSFSMVMGIGFLLLVSLVLSAGLSVMGNYFNGLFPGIAVLMKVVSFVLSLGIISCLFAMMFKFLPDAKISWHDVWFGAVLTALLFTIGKFALGFYFGNAKIGSAYGAAGSMILLLLWVYYSSQLLFFGAEFTQVYAHFCGTRACDNPEALVAPAKKLKTRKDKVLAASQHRRHEMDILCKRVLGWKVVPRDEDLKGPRSRFTANGGAGKGHSRN